MKSNYPEGSVVNGKELTHWNKVVLNLLDLTKDRLCKFGITKVQGYKQGLFNSVIDRETQIQPPSDH